VRILLLAVGFLISTQSFAEAPIANFHKVSPVLYRGAKPQDEQSVAFLRGLGVRTIFNLQGDEALTVFFPDERPAAIQQEGRWAQRNGMGYVNVAVPALHFPYYNEDMQIRNLVARMRKPSLQPGYVHCRIGDDRTSLVVALYQFCTNHTDPTVLHDQMVAQGHSGVNGFFTPEIDKYFWSAVRTPDWCQ
jgi:protein tyrosine/serine phosphatase